MTGGPGQGAGEGVSYSESPGQPAPSPAWSPVSSLTGDGKSRAQAPQREGLQGWTLAAACLGHTQERGAHPQDRRQTTWRSCPQSREPGAQPQRASLRRRPRAAHRKRVGGLRGRGVQPPDPGGLPTETVWTGKQGKSRSVQKLLGTTSDNPSACSLTTRSTKKKRLVSETRLCTLLSST